MDESMDYLFVDSGSSGVKILASVGGFYQSHFVQPGARKIRALSDLEQMEESRLNYPFGSGVVEFGGETWRVGNKPLVCHTSELKIATLISKVIAAIGSLYGDRSNELTLVLLLPYDEFASRRELAARLREALGKGASYNGKTINAVISKMYIHPEGSGLSVPPMGTHAGIMLGHTDMTVIRFDDGRCNLTASVTFGGSGVGCIGRMLGVPGRDADVSKAIMTRKLKSLASSGIPHTDVEQSAQRAVETYRDETLVQCLKGYPWSEIESAVLSGGGAKFLKSAIAAIVPVKVSLSEPPEGIKLFGNVDPLIYSDIYGKAHHYLGDEIKRKLNEPDNWSEEVHPVSVEVVNV